MPDTKEEKLKKAKKIYADTLAKLNALQADYKAVLDGTKKRITEERLNQIRNNLKKLHNQ